MNRQGVVVTGVLVACVSLMPALRAQAPDELRAPSYSGQTGLFFTVDSRTVSWGEWVVGFSAANFDQLYPEAPELRPESDRPFRGYDIDRGEFRLFAAYGMTDDWEIAAAIPYIYYNQNIGDVAGFVEGLPRVGEFTDEGFGDLTVMTKLRWIDRESLGVAGSLGIELPTGETEGGISSGDWGISAGVHVDLAAFTLSGIYRHRGEREAGDTPLGVPFDLADEIHLDAGWQYRHPRWAATTMIGELNGIVFTGGDRRADDALYGTVGVRHRWGGTCWMTDAAVNYNITMGTSDNPSHPIGGLFSISCEIGR